MCQFLLEKILLIFFNIIFVKGLLGGLLERGRVTFWEDAQVMEEIIEKAGLEEEGQRGGEE